MGVHEKEDDSRVQAMACRSQRWPLPADHLTSLEKVVYRECTHLTCSVLGARRLGAIEPSTSTRWEDSDESLEAMWTSYDMLLQGPRRAV
jgi:hypothetical protein